MIQTKKTESKWKKDENGENVTREYPVCKAEEEDCDHYDYECRGRSEGDESAEASGAWRKKGWRRK